MSGGRGKISLQQPVVKLGFLLLMQSPRTEGKKESSYKGREICTSLASLGNPQEAPGQSYLNLGPLQQWKQQEHACWHAAIFSQCIPGLGKVIPQQREHPRASAPVGPNSALKKKSWNTNSLWTINVDGYKLRNMDKQTMEFCSVMKQTTDTCNNRWISKTLCSAKKTKHKWVHKEYIV